MSILFGNLTQDFVSFGTAENAYFQDVNNATAVQQLNAAAAQFRKNSAADASYLVCIGMSPTHSLRLLAHTPPGVGLFVCTYIYMVIWVYTGEVNAKRIREKYLQAVLRQDIAYFDTVGAGEVATRIQTDTRMSIPSPISFHSQPPPSPQISYSRACPKKSFLLSASSVLSLPALSSHMLASGDSPLQCLPSFLASELPAV